MKTPTHLLRACLLVMLLGCPLSMPLFAQSLPVKSPSPVAVTTASVASGTTQAATAKKPEKPRKFPIFESFPLNVAVFRAVNSRRHPALDAFFTALIPLGKATVFIPFLILFIIIPSRRWKIAPLLIALAVESLIVLKLMKPFFNQPRPLALLDNVFILTEHHKMGSFPSGDVACIFALAVILSYREKWWVYLASGLFGALIAYERMYAGMHFPFDVCTGALVGVLSGVIGLAIPVWVKSIACWIKSRKNGDHPPQKQASDSPLEGA